MRLSAETMQAVQWLGRRACPRCRFRYNVADPHGARRGFRNNDSLLCQHCEGELLVKARLGTLPVPGSVEWERMMREFFGKEAV